MTKYGIFATDDIGKVILIDIHLNRESAINRLREIKNVYKIIEVGQYIFDHKLTDFWMQEITQ